MDYQQDDIKREAFDLALHTYATHYMYALKQARRSKWIKAITLLGFIVPVLLGGIVSSYGLDSTISQTALYILTPVAIVQLILSTLSLIYKWDDECSYFLESAIANRALSDEFHRLAKYPLSDVTSYRHAFELLLERNSNREEQDDKYPFTENENRKAMRYALRRFERSCSGCGIIPRDMVSTDCGVCGNFK